MNNISIALLVAFLISFLVTNFLVPRLLVASLKRRLLDVPNKRSSHHVVASRLGGVSFLPSVLVSVCAVVALWQVFDNVLIAPSDALQYIILICACVVMYAVGLFDDVVGLKFKMKFVAQFVASVLIVSSGVWVDNFHGLFGVNEVAMWIGIPFTILLIMFVINAVNLIDGIDGLASGLSIVAMVVYGLLFTYLGDNGQALVAFSLVGCLIAFFYYNVRGFSNKTIKIFMGDTGSLVTGTIISLCAIKLIQSDTVGADMSGFSMLMAYSVLVVPCFDAIRVMIERRRNGKSMFLPDKNHIHHRVLSLGLNERVSMIVIVCLSVVITLLNAGLYFLLSIEWIILVDVIVFALFHAYISRAIASQKKIENKD